MRTKHRIQNPGVGFLSVIVLVGVLQATSAHAVKFRLPLSSDTGVHYYYDHNTSSGITAWNCSGTSYDGHQGTDYSGGPRGRAILAGANGTLNYKVDGFGDGYAGSAAGGGAGNHVRIDHGGGVMTWYMHMTVGSVTGKPVGSGIACSEQIGGVGTSGSSTGLHLHFDLRINGARRDPYIGSCGGLGYWVNQGSGSPSTACEGGGTPGTVHQYLGALGGDGTLLAKDGPYGGWTTQLGGVSAFQIEGGRIGLLSGGALLCKDGGLWGGWVNQSAGGVAKFQLCGNRIGALYGNGILSCKDGLFGSWYDQLTGVSAFHLDGDRIGILAGGVVYTKRGLQGAWITQTGAGGFVKLQIEGERLGVLHSSGLFTCKDTDYGAWYNQLGGVTDFRLDGNRIAALAGGSLYVKDGLQGAWTTQIGPGVVQIEVQGERIGALTSDGTLYCKDGVFGSWFTQLGGVRRFQLDGDRIGIITTGGTVTLKYGLQGGWLNQTGNGFADFQMATWAE